MTQGAGPKPASGGRIGAPPVALSPISVPLAELFNVAVEYERGGRLADAERVLGHILAAAPQQPDALHLAGIVAFRLGRAQDALALMQRSLDHGGNAAIHVRNLGEVLRVLDRLDEALAAGERALALDPNDPTTLTNLAVIHADRAELDQSAARARAALALDPRNPSAHFGLAEALLARGDFAQGWEEYEYRFDLPGGAANLPPGSVKWDGAPCPAGRLLVVADQGVGDVIQFCRFLPWLRQRCPDPLIVAAPDLHPILRQLGLTQIHASWRNLPDHNAVVPLSGLPRLAATRLDTIPAPIPYLHADPSRAASWRQRLDALLPAGTRRIGLVWAGAATHVNDSRRSARLAALAPLFDLPGTAYVALQKSAGQAEVAGYFGHAQLLSLGPSLGGWDDTMAVLDGLEALVSVDTAVAHLAGAMGRPVHLLLPHAAEWRWLQHRSDSPWYPTMRLHRQPGFGQWAQAAMSVRAALQDAG